jgi:flap endonuclease-1
MGPKTAFKMIKKHGNIETVLENLTGKYIVPEDYILKLETVRNLFKYPDVIPASEIEFVFRKPDSEKIIDFLVTKKSFSRERVEKVIAKITKADPKQSKIDSFFKKKE